MHAAAFKSASVGVKLFLTASLSLCDAYAICTMKQHITLFVFKRGSHFLAAHKAVAKD